MNVQSRDEIGFEQFAGHGRYDRHHVANLKQTALFLRCDNDKVEMAGDGATGIQAQCAFWGKMGIEDQFSTYRTCWRILLAGVAT